MTRTIRRVMPLLLLLPLSACASSPATPRQTTATPETRRPVALINGRAIEAEAIREACHEIAGDEALAEHALDRALEQRCREMGIEITDELIERERAMLGQFVGIADGQPLPTDVFEELRARRALGPNRFPRLLRRNAMLRALVGPVEPDGEQIEQARRRAFGTGYRVRLFVARTPEEAGRVRRAAMDADPASRPWVFAEHCADSSLHPSGELGGLIRRVTADDTNYPSAMLTALTRTEPGTCSPVLSTEAGYLVLYVERIIPERVPDERELRDLTEQLRRDLQRTRMERYARELLEQQEIIPTDRSLNWAWTNRAR